MTSLLQRNEYLDALAEEHRAWLDGLEGQYLANWEKLYRADFEAAMAEASVRRLLQMRGVEVTPNEDLTGARQQPDFACLKDGERFYIEVACISIENVVKETRLPYPTEPDVRHYAPLNDAFWSACKGKAAQCGGVEYPVLVAIGTFHVAASALCVSEAKAGMLLTGTTSIALNLDASTGEAVGEPFLQTALYSAAFLRPDREGGLVFARSSISGLLLCGLAGEPPNVLGILHPNPARPFNPQLLQGIQFGEVEIDDELKSLRVRWSEK